MNINLFDTKVKCFSVVYCLLITLTCSLKAKLRRAQLNGIGRMNVKGVSGSRQTAMNDPGAQPPSQMFLTWVKARPQHRELRALRAPFHFPTNFCFSDMTYLCIQRNPQQLLVSRVYHCNLSYTVHNFFLLCCECNYTGHTPDKIQSAFSLSF